MSRTYRRNQKDLIRRKRGLPTDVEAYFFGSISETGKWIQWVEWHPRYENEEHYKRSVNRFKSDGYRRWYSAPRWWRKLHFIDPERRDAKLEIVRCLNQGSFDDHQDPRYRGANWQWRWWMT